MSHRTQRLAGLSWHIIGLASALGLYFLTSYFAFFEGCILALYTASLWPHLAKRVTHYPPGQVIPLALLSWGLLATASVWVVAYNFVPGGTLTRERTDVLITVTIFLVAIASRNYDRPEGFSGESVSGEMGAKGEVGQNGRTLGEGREREGLRQRHVHQLPSISEEDEIDEGESEDERDGQLDFEVDSTGSSVHEERAMELLVAEEKECLKFRHRANHSMYNTSSTHTHTHYVLFRSSVAVAILLFALVGFACRYHSISPQRQTVIVCVFLHL